MSRDLSLRQARRIALAAQGLAAPRADGPVTRRRLRGLAGELGVIQIDSVNVLARTHYLPAFSRLGPYPRTLLEDEAWGRTPSLFEYWGHEASLMPVAMQPLFRWRMARFAASETPFRQGRRAYMTAVLKRIEAEGPLSGGDFGEAPAAGAERPRKGGWWNRSDGKRALEALFAEGLITTRTRRGFERIYDLTERVIPRAIMAQPTPSEAEAHRALLMISARAMGVATEFDLRDYFRLPVAETSARLAELVEDGALEPVRVPGWRRPAYLAPDARLPRQARASALLSPFDNLIWYRERTERLFGARIRLEIYTPSAKREHGYYVLPFLFGDAIAARVDLKADRAARTLLVQAAHLEPGADQAAVAPALADELALMAGWLDLDAVAVRPRGDLAGALRRAVG
ncbi:MAG TPA: crosslink repair DNA glycosylase YcaQ family protein [Caulobacteraceae bacterium]|jgi:hypothetical protein|nr:crosslink repair DNA glycosylase YcaQ family protein [Caulobacteraceae bacterium]